MLQVKKNQIRSLIVLSVIIFYFILQVEHGSYVKSSGNSNKIMSKTKSNYTGFEELKPLMFFSRSVAYYFIDQKFGRVMFSTNDKVQVNISVQLNVYRDDYFISSHLIDKVQLEYDGLKVFYTSVTYSLYFDFKMSEINDVKSIENYKMEIFILNNIKKTKTQDPIELKIKNFRKIKNDPEIKYAMVCSKCFAFTDDSRAAHLKWWFEMNKQIGYSKVSFCNRSIPNTPAFNDIFYEYLC
jgi:hypothetical protein